jgi:hypothetical protein
MSVLVFWVVTPCGLAARPTFRRNTLPSSSGMKMEAVCSSETLVAIYKSIWRKYPEDQHRHFHRQNLESHTQRTFLRIDFFTP